MELPTRNRLPLAARILALAALGAPLLAATPPQEEPAAVHEFLLEYRESVPPRVFRAGDDQLRREVLWDSERSSIAELDGRGARRGAIRVGDHRVVQLAWDEPAGTLFVDRNGNEDLSDDEPVRRISLWDGGALIEDFELTAPEGVERGKWNVYLMADRIDPSAEAWVAIVDSGWTGKIELRGATYRLSVLDDLDGTFTPRSDALWLGPWTEEPEAPASARFALPERLLLGGALYTLSFALEPGSAGDVVRATLTESSEPLERCELLGTHVSRLLLESVADAPHPTTVLLEEPSGALHLPAGEYVARIEIDGEGLGRLRSEVGLVVTPGGENVLRAGGPLDNGLTFRRSSATGVELEYRLRGIGGEGYDVSTRSDPAPRFVARAGGGEIASGSFRYG